MDNSVDNKSGPEGIGGWLILVAIMLVSSIIRITYGFLETFLPFWLNFDEASEYLSSITDDWYSLFIFETVGNSLMILFTLYVIWLFFSKNYKTPIMYIILTVGSLLFRFIDTAYAVKILGPSSFEKGEAGELAGQFVSCLVWGAYFLMSERVKNTFVKGRKERKPANQLVN